MKRFSFFIFAIALVVTLVCSAGSGLAANKIILKIAHVNSTAPNSNGLQAQALVFADLVNTKSSGRIEVQVFGGGSLGGERELIEGVKNGTIESAMCSGALTNFYKEAMVTDLPYLFINNKVVWAVMDGPFGKKLSDRLLKQTGMRNLGFGEIGFRNFTNNKRPIHTPQDLKGLKIRVQETPFYLTMIKAMDANPTPVAWPETYSALQTGVVDGEENPVAVIVFSKLYEVQKYCILDGHVYGVSWFLMNDKFFQGLPSDLRKIVLEAARTASLEGRRVQSQLSEDGVKTLISKSVEVYTPTAADIGLFRKATQKPCIDWMKTQIDNDIIDGILKAVKSSEAKLK